MSPNWLRRAQNRLALGSKSRPVRGPRRPSLESLESRLAPATLTVNTPLDNTTADGLLSLREAVLLVDNGGNAQAALGRALTAAEAGQIAGTFGSNDTIRFAASLTGQVITLGGSDLTVSAPAAITGPGSANLTISGNNASRILTVYNASDGTSTLPQPFDVAVSGLTLTGGSVPSGRGGAVDNLARLTLTDVVVTGSTAEVCGGVFNLGTLAMSGCTVSGCTGTLGLGGVGNSGTMTLTGCTVSDNSASGAVSGLALAAGIGNVGTMTLVNSTVTGNQATATTLAVEGGIANSGTLTLTGSTVSDNTVSAGGPGSAGAGWAVAAGIGGAGTMTLVNSTVTGNQATSDNVAAVGGVGSTGTMTLTGCTVSDNSVTANGSASAGTGVAVAAGVLNLGTMTLVNSTVSGNQATASSLAAAGGIANGGALTLTGSTVTGNTAGASIGAVAAGIYSFGTLTLTDSTVSQNVGSTPAGGVAGGGGILNDGGTLTATDSTVYGNGVVTTDGGGGGLYNTGGGTAVLTGCDVSWNVVSAGDTGAGGGIYNDATLTALDCTFTWNEAGGQFGSGGGAIYSGAAPAGSKSTLTVTNCTFADNHTEGLGALETDLVTGAGIFIDVGATAAVSDCTLWDNAEVLGTQGVAELGTGIANFGALALNNTIVDGEHDRPDGVIDGDFASLNALGSPPAVLTGGNNIIGSGVGLGGLSGTISADPMLGPLQFNGGPTLTMAPSPGSPALDAGNNGLVPAGVTTDQRGFARVYNGTVDVGAVEVSPPVVATTTALAVYDAYLGQPTKITATVTGGGMAADGNVTFLEGSTVLASNVPLDANGQASFTTTSLTPGPHTITVDYGGTIYYIPGSSSVSFTVGIAPVGFGAIHSFGTGTLSYQVAMGDFNGDGIADLAVTNAGDGTVSVLLSNGDGTFKTAVNYAAGTTPTGITAADLNHDGKLDLIVANYGDNTVSVLMGNGNGTFQPGRSYAAGSRPIAVAVGDFNGDGKLDVAVADYDDTVTVLMGNGDGTFRAPDTFQAGAQGNSGIAVGDLAGNGKQDIVVTSPYAGTVAVLMGNGDGTFRPGVNYAAGPDPFSLVLADFNGDGKLDMATANASGVTVLMGNGDGTFRPGGSYVASAFSLAVGDFTGDGKLDLAAVGTGTNEVQVLLGNGDGTFQYPLFFDSGAPGNTGIAVGDFNGDGLSDVAFVSPVANDVGVLMNTDNPVPRLTSLSTTSVQVDSAAFTLTVTGGRFVGASTVDWNGTALATTFVNGGELQVTVPAALLAQAGPASITVVSPYPGGGSSAALTFTVTKAPSATVVTSSANPVAHDQVVTFTATVSGLAGLTPTGTVQFQIDGQKVGSPVALGPNGTATYRNSALGAGSHTVTAVYAGDGNFLGSTAPTFTEVVLGPGVTLIGTALYVVGGNTSNDNVQITPVGASTTGSTGVKVQANLNKSSITTTYSQALTAIHVIGYAGNDNVTMAPTLTVNTSVSAGGGNDNVVLGGGANVITLGGGNDNVAAGDGANTVALGDGNDNVALGSGDNTLALGNGNDNVLLGNGNNVVVMGHGNNFVAAGNGDNLIAAGLGHHTVLVGNGSNILIDGSVALTNSGDSLRQVLGDWAQSGAAAAGSIRSRLAVTLNSSYANVMLAGGGLDWFWDTYAKDTANRKATDLLN